MLRRLLALSPAFLALSACQAPAPLQAPVSAASTRHVQAAPVNYWSITWTGSSITYKGKGTWTELGWNGNFFRIQYTAPAKLGLVCSGAKGGTVGLTGAYMPATINGVPFGGIDYETPQTCNDCNGTVPHTTPPALPFFIVGPGETLVFGFPYLSPIKAEGYTQDLAASSQQSGQIVGVK